MANPNKDKGTRAETYFTRFAIANGFPDAERIDLGQGHGDVRLRKGLHVQVKNRPKSYSALIPPYDWLEETRLQASNATRDLNRPVAAFLVVKPPGIGFDRVGDWHAWIDLAKLEPVPPIADVSGTIVGPLRLAVHSALQLMED